MLKTNFTDERQVAWLDVLLRSLPPEARAPLLDRLTQPTLAAERGDDPIPALSQGRGAAPAALRLLAFYIAQAQARSASGDPAARDAAQRDLEFIHTRLAEDASRGQPQPAGSGAATADPRPDPAAPAPPAQGAAQSLDEAIRLAYRLAVKREPVEDEIQIWQRNFANGLPFHEFLLGMSKGAEARARQAAEHVGGDMSDGDFVLALFRIVRGRGCNAYELQAVRKRLESGAATRPNLLAEFFSEAVKEERSGADQAVHDGLSCSIMGTARFLTLAEWQKKAEDTEALAAARAALRPATPFTLRAEAGLRVSAITSLYCGGDFIEQFMDNITSQTCFDRHCELIIVDADSPENEAETIARYLDRHENIRYQRMNSRIGIYEAWNVGVQMARGPYLTNANLDDLRRADSFEIQAGALDALPFADVVYQDFYYSFDPRLDWEGVAAFGYKSALPVVTPHNMLRFNSPHNAPMWRKALHDELGLFDANYKSAGDYEFWLRCLAAGKTFYKVNEPHVVYYQNPKGLSTRADTRGIIEGKAVTRKYAPLLMPEELTCDFDDFVTRFLGGDAEPEQFPNHDRHVAVQKTLRDLTRRFKQGKP
ncbi:glycosyltransferase [Actibacterium sp. MT2.3-13A]|uniref:glycosyltransferase n=1 Tax=Actibacterium sp. MT2.3-13A TaxID=2828332 RepID=UPI001BAD7A6B|nr:glycosyltransferase [Actibacterium sp. MT2.3-13A]